MRGQPCSPWHLQLGHPSPVPSPASSSSSRTAQTPILLSLHSPCSLAPPCPRSSLLLTLGHLPGLPWRGGRGHTELAQSRGCDRHLGTRLWTIPFLPVPLSRCFAYSSSVSECDQLFDGEGGEDFVPSYLVFGQSLSVLGWEAAAPPVPALLQGVLLICCCGEGHGQGCRKPGSSPEPFLPQSQPQRLGRAEYITAAPAGPARPRPHPLSTRLCSQGGALRVILPQ